ncbi:MAG: sugar phosphate isomerase/epimerase, partial [Planctomycetes bacterium]|nr:sugar phosphate isomerase/epimerase [Planctomycetota bacterium]
AEFVMHQEQTFQVHGIWFVAWLAGLACAAGAVRPSHVHAAPPPGQSVPKLYGFCMEIHDAKKRDLPEQATMLCELGFDGVGYPLWLDETLEKNLDVLDKSGLPVYLMYTPVNVAPGKPPYDERLEPAIQKLRGRPVTISVLLRGLPPGDPRGMDAAVKLLRRLGDVAHAAGLRISIYHHTADWAESLPFALEVVDRVNHPQVGANFNLCHWLKIEGNRDFQPVLRQHAKKIFAVTINGAQPGAAAWTNGLIQPLGCGDFDNQRLLALLQEIGYDGPIGLMCYGIPGDSREHLEHSIAVWKGWFDRDGRVENEEE